MTDSDTTPLAILTPVGSENSGGGIGQRSVTAAINARTPLPLMLDGIAGDTVDLLNNLTTGALVRKLAGTPPGPQGRTYELELLPDPGSGSLALPPLIRGNRLGTLTFVDLNGQPATGSSIAGVSLTSGAFLNSSEMFAPTIDLSTGWRLRFSFRTPSGVNNSSCPWASFGRRTASGSYGVTAYEVGGGALEAAIEDPRFGRVLIRSLATPRNQRVDAELTWDAAAQRLQWRVNGALSGAAVSCSFRPDVAGGKFFVGTNLALTTAYTPTGAIFAAGLDILNAGVADSYVPVPSTATLSIAEAQELIVDTIGLYAAVPAAGTIEVRYQTAAGEGGENIAVAIDGYTNIVEQLSRLVSGDSPFTTIDLGSAPVAQALVLTPPGRGRIATASSVEYRGPGTLVDLSANGNPVRATTAFDPTGGTGAGANPAGGVTRGWTGPMRLQQGNAVREVTLTELNNPPRLNGGGEAWGHADDLWVPILALMNGYQTSDYLFPKLRTESPVVTVAAVPEAGAGSIRIGREGADLAVGDSVPFDQVKRLGWWKPRVSAVSISCALELTISVPGASSRETYALKITDAPRPAAFGWWEQASVLMADDHTGLRWASRGGDWSGIDGLYGAQPHLQTAAITSAQTVTIDVTQMVRAFGPQFFLRASSTTASVVLQPPANAQNTAAEPLLRVADGPRAGTYKASRYGQLADSDSTGWRQNNTGLGWIVLRTQPAVLGFDGAGTAAQLASASRIELVLTVAGTFGGGTALQLFRPTPVPPRPGPRLTVADSTPTRQRSDLLVAVDRNEDWQAMLANASPRERSGGQPSGAVVANGCIYGAIPTGTNTGLDLLRGFWRDDGTGYPVIRMARMVGWHANYRPSDSNLGASPGVSGKSPGPFATGKANLSSIDEGRGGRAISGLGGWSCRMQRGRGTDMVNPSTSPLGPWMAFGDYNYFLSGDTNGLTVFGVNPLPRMRWLWIETVHAVNSLTPDGRWQRDGVFELYVNGRKYCESRSLEYRISGNPWLWDAIWFNEYNGGTTSSLVDRPWPFVVGPTYVVSGTAPVAPPAGWSVPFVAADGKPGEVLSYVPDIS
jgi:hypothetical protein